MRRKRCDASPFERSLVTHYFFCWWLAEGERKSFGNGIGCYHDGVLITTLYQGVLLTKKFSFHVHHHPVVIEFPRLNEYNRMFL